MTTHTWSLGKDVSLVIVGPDGSTLDLPNVTAFTSKPSYKEVKSQVLNGPPIQRNVPDGWTGEVSFDRTSVAIDALIAVQEGSFWLAGGDVGVGTIYQYVTESNGSTSAFEYTECAMSFDTGSWKSDTTVEMKLKFYARYRNAI
ncbi:hypothetical protein FHR90_003250 [Endobacter medicaginis]|uniref:Phage tail protein n=1 Tax=Endobacter medicaginis TaxID=1181271 RepID=A0A839V3G5_9PROT|nr:hypothetical protein [Endobacter medicaginis]MBB3175395.1 hypothetical protein [Endobacter medicaginis]MCX5476737.1 hypothetical protein [Endobacter medicaginis]NVN29343.1 hypothetical protein [Endobacter medicaginis]